MKLTNQTKYSLFYSDGTRLTYGNCLIACVASFLDEPIDEVPNVYTFYGLDEKDKTTEDHAWFKVMNLWLDLKHQKCIKIHSLDEVTKEEEMAVAEFTGMIAHYVGSEKGGKMNMYEVNIVPQDDKQINAVKEILPELDVVIDRGGKVFKVGRYFSEDYAEAVCEKYITLGLYSVTSKVVVDLSKD